MRKYKYIVLEGQGTTNRKEPVEEWEYWAPKNESKKFNGPRKFAKFQYPVDTSHVKHDTSEIAFWKKINEFELDDEFIIIPCSGNGNVDFIMYHLCNRATTEKIILCLDWYVNSDTKRLLQRLAKKYSDICKKNGVQLHVIEGYTFEWVVLSSTNLLKMARCYRYYRMNRNNARLWNIHIYLLSIDPSRLNKANNSDVITNGFNLIDQLEKAGVSSIKTKTFEVISSEFLELVLSGTGFLINKSGLGKCWLYPCNLSLSCKMIEDYTNIGNIPPEMECGLIQQAPVENLTYIDCNGNKILVPAVKTLKKMPNLQEKFQLILSTSKVFQAILEKLRSE